MMATSLALYGLAWASFGALHSVLASDRVRRRVVRLTGRAERLSYNVVAAVHLAAVLWIGNAVLGHDPRFAMSATATWLMRAIVAVGACVLVVAGRAYQAGRFAGVTQLRGPADAGSLAAEPLVTGGLHRYVRHPLYFGGLLVVWGLATSALGVATATFATIYLLIGMTLEERRLLATYGAEYADYRARVPALLPGVRLG